MENIKVWKLFNKYRFPKELCSLLINNIGKAIQLYMSLKGYSQGADEEDWAQKTSQDGEPLGGCQLLTEHLHPREYQHREQTG